MFSSLAFVVIAEVCLAAGAIAIAFRRPELTSETFASVERSLAVLAVGLAALAVRLRTLRVLAGIAHLDRH